MRVETAAAAKDVVVCHNMEGAAGVLLVCEHASRYIPSGLNDLGLSPAHLDSHAVWDPGAMAVATHMANLLDARLVAGAVSRLVYDCNRAPGAVDAMPARSERVDVPGNAALSTVERARRLAEYYTPFHDAVAGALVTMTTPTLVTVHSFAPVWHGRTREVEIGILHDDDRRLADAMLATAPSGHDIRRNEPYGPADGVTHTLREHALPFGHPNVMIEVRNDLIAQAEQQQTMAEILADWLTRSITTLDTQGRTAWTA